MNHPLSDMMMSSMGKIRDMIDVNTVIGEPIAAGDVTIIPVTKVSIGYGAGGSDFATKNYPANRDNAFGGGAGAGVNITPVAFLVVRGAVQAQRKFSSARSILKIEIASVVAVMTGA